MKCQNVVLGAALSLLTGSNLVEAVDVNPQQLLQIPFVDSALNWWAEKRPAELVSQAAEFFNEPLRNIPSEVISAWNSVGAENSEKLKQSLQLSSPVKATHRADDTWKHIVTKEEYPNHKLRVKQPYELEIDSVKQYSGYLDLDAEDKHFFFWFFESRNDPENDPVILWLNGGPGCSSMTGLLFELGPSFIKKDHGMEYNDFAWNSNASVIFLDQPVNVGFSYSSKPVSTTKAAGEDVLALLELFFEQFPEYAKNDFHIAGESYAGHYIPSFARTIVEQGENKGFNLTSVLIGNGITDAYHQIPSYEGMACGKGGYPAVLDEGNCTKIHNMIPRCQELTKICYKYQNPLACLPSVVYCERLLQPYVDTGLNVYDIRMECGDSDLCYEEDNWIQEYFNQQYVKEAIGAEVDEFVGCSNQVGFRFATHGDEGLPFQYDVKYLLDSEIPVLIYAGDKDYICNWLGNELWTHALEWTGQDKFVERNMSNWKIDGETVGEVKSSGPLTFLRLYDAGHMVPHDQPKNSLAMANTWVSGNYEFE